MGLMIEKLRSLLHETMIIFIRNSLPDVKTYMMQNTESIHTMDDAVKWGEHFEASQAKMPPIKVSALSPQHGVEEVEEWCEEGTEDAHDVDAFGQRTGRDFNRRRYFRGGSSGSSGGQGRFGRIQDVAFRGQSLPTNHVLGGVSRSDRSGRFGSAGISQFGSQSTNRNQTQQQAQTGNCHGCGLPGHFVRNCPRISAINNGNRGYGGYFGGRFQSFRGGPPKGGRWIRIRKDFGNGRSNVSAIEDAEEELVWQEDDEDEYVEALEEDFRQQQQINVVEEVENQEQYTPDITM